MSRLAILLGLALVVVMPSPSHALTAQQQRMKECNAEAAGKSSAERKQFMKACLHAPKTLYCSHGKACGNACIAANETCRQ